MKDRDEKNTTIASEENKQGFVTNVEVVPFSQSAYLD
jgi:hypothetical protein